MTRLSSLVGLYLLLVNPLPPTAALRTLDSASVISSVGAQPAATHRGHGAGGGGAAATLHPGGVFGRGGRYVLRARLAAGPLRGPALLQQGADDPDKDTSPKKPPGSASEVLDNVKGDSWRRLAGGSFGETWKAWDKKTSKSIAVKFFFKRKRGESEKFMTWDNTEGNRKERNILRSEIKACNQVAALVRRAKRESNPAAKHIANCLQVHGLDTLRARRQPAFVVQEFGGKPLIKWTPRTAAERLEGAREITFQLLGVLDILGSLATQVLLHHDLKPSNVVFTTDDAGLPQIKVIDWGGMVWVQDYTTKKSGQPRMCIGTPWYAPPESSQGCFSKRHPASFDVFAAGAIYARGLCDREDWYKKEEGKGTVFSKDLRAMEEHARQEGFFFPKTDAALVDAMLSRRPANRPTVWQAASHPALSPRWFSTLLGLWSDPSPSVSYRRSYRFERQSDASVLPITVLVLKDGKEKGNGTIADKTCAAALSNFDCCNVEVEYRKRWFSFKALARRARILPMRLVMCPVSYASLLVNEQVDEAPVPKMVIAEPKIFRRWS